MGIHCGRHYYALCDAWDNEIGRRCESSVVPTECPDVFLPASVLVPARDAYAAAKAAGWQITYDGETATTLCPRHRTKQAAKPAEVVDVPLFDLVPDQPV